MALQKGFLHSKAAHVIPKGHRFISGIALGLAFILVLYVLMYYFRELLRTMWTDALYCDVVVLTKKEVNFFNTICAFIAAIFGQSVCFSIWFNKPGQKRGITRMLSDLWSLNFVFLGMFTGLVCEMGLIFFWRTEFEFGLYPGFNIYFILAVIVLFLQQWVSFNRIFKRKGMVMMLFSASIVCAVSFSLSRINYTDYEAFNREMQSRSIYHQYHIDWPRVDDTRNVNSWRYRYILEGNIYIANTRHYPSDSSVVFIMNNMNYSIRADSLVEVERDNLRSVLEYWQGLKGLDTDPLDTYQLKINRNIPMSTVNRLKTDLVRSGIQRVRYAVLPTEFKSGETFRYHDDWLMIDMCIPDYYAYGKDSLRKIERSIHRAISNIINVSTGEKEGSYILNGMQVDFPELKDLLKTLITVNPDYWVIYDIGDEDLFQDYINIVSALHSTIGELRASYLLETDGKEIFRISCSEEEDLTNGFPVRLFEITEEFRSLDLPNTVM